MKKSLFLLCLALSSCQTFQSSGEGARLFNTRSSINISNNWEMVPGEAAITYTIDISTAEGQQKLYKRTLDEAKILAVNEAAQKYGAATIINPNFTWLKKGNREILRITVQGFPAYYKNAGYFNRQTEHPGGNSNINVRINQ